MAIIVSDDFTRANNPTSMGTATTGQVWSQVSGTADWGINSNQSLYAWDYFEATGIAVLETGFTGAITQVKLVNPVYPTLPHFGASVGVVCRYVDNNYYFSLIYGQFPGANRLRLQRVYAGSTTTVGIDVDVTLAANDVISVAYCGSNFEVFLNDVSQGTYDDSLNPQNYGTKSGLINRPGTVFFSYQQRFDDFLVETNGTCTPTYNCTLGACVDPGDGSGTYATLAACLSGCGDIPVTYNCVDGTCVDPGDGSGDFATLLECQNSGCSIPPIPGIGSERFDSGNGTSYYVVPQIDDSGDELRSKTIKAAYVVGKKTNASIQVYGWDVKQEINMTELEDGTRINGSTAPQALLDSTDVTQSKRQPVNVKNATVSTVRVAGDCTGEEVMDRIDSIVVEVADQGVRR